LVTLVAASVFFFVDFVDFAALGLIVFSATYVTSPGRLRPEGPGREHLVRIVRLRARFRCDARHNPHRDLGHRSDVLPVTRSWVSCITCSM
jgi:hypothetical protein